MTDGIVLKFSAAEAVEEEKQLKKAIDDAIKSIGAQGKEIDALEKKLRSTQGQLEAMRGSVSGTSEQLLKVATGFGVYGAEAGKAAGKSKDLKDAIEGSGGAANKAQGFFQKLLGASGIKGAGPLFGAVTSGVRALGGALGPAGIAATAVSIGLGLLATRASTARNETKELTAAAIEQQQKFSTLRDAIDGVSKGFERIGSSQARFVGFEGAEKEATRLAAVQQSLVETQTEFNERLRRTSGAVVLNVEEIKKLGEATGQSAQFFRDLEKASRGDGDSGERLALNRLRERIGLQKQDGALVVDAASVQKALNREYEITGRLIENNNKRLAEEKELAIEESLVQLAQATKARASDAAPGVGDAEREARARIREIERKSVLGLTDAQRSLVKVITDEAKASDEAKRAHDDLQKQREADHRYQETLRQINDETEVLLAATEKEIRAKKELAAANDAVAQSGAGPGSARESEIRKAVKAREEARYYEEQLRKVQQLGRDTFGTIGQNIANAVENGASFREFLQGTIKDLERLALQRIVVDQLANLGSSLFGAAFGPSRPAGYRANGGVLPGGGAGPQYFAASGMVLDRSTTIHRAGYSVNAAEGGGSAPEAIVPLGRDKYGRLGIIAADGGGGGGGVTFVLPNVRSAEDARQVRPTLRQTMGSLDRARGRWRNGARGAV